jgi:hypothetical protein
MAARWIGALALAVAAGCAGVGTEPRWVREGSSQAELDRDRADCMAQATEAADPGSSDPTDRARIGGAFENCMESRGWRRNP